MQGRWGEGEAMISPGLANQVMAVRQGLSRGVKFLMLCGMALGMSLLALFVSSMTDDRSGRAEAVRKELSAEMGGPQVYLGPTLLVPYTQPGGDGKQVPRTGVFAIAPKTGTAELAIHAEERRRSLFRVPVFQSEAKLQATFDLSDVTQPMAEGAVVDWSRAAVVVGVMDARSAMEEGSLQFAGGSLPLAPVEVQRSLQVDGKDGVPPLTLLGVSAGQVSRAAPFTVVAHLHFRGAQRAAVLAYARATTVRMRGDWRSPSFEGALLPVKQEVSEKGFAAEWFVPSMARGIAPVADTTALGGLGATTMAMRLVEVADPYQSVNRALKYAPLFLGLVFLSYFLFEVTASQPVHAAQYVLVGTAQMVFYLLLLSLAERMGFDWSFLLAGSATVLLLGWNAGWVFRSGVQRVRALALFAVLYGLIYALLRLEDNALLVGAVGSFAAVGAAMYLTRGMDWYGDTETAKAKA